jgi:PilZ domain-containing protein
MDFLNVERRTAEREWVKRAAVLTLAGSPVPHLCGVRDLSRDGAGLRLDGLLLVPTAFRLSFNGGRSMAAVDLIWREGDFAGVAFHSGRIRDTGVE